MASGASGFHAGEQIKRFATEGTEKRRRKQRKTKGKITAEAQSTQRKPGEIPAYGGDGLKQRRRPQDDDAHRIDKG